MDEKIERKKKADSPPHFKTSLWHLTVNHAVTLLFVITPSKHLKSDYDRKASKLDMNISQHLFSASDG